MTQSSQAASSSPPSSARRTSGSEWTLTTSGAPTLALVPERGVVELTPVFSLESWYARYDVSSFSLDGVERAWIVYSGIVPGGGFESQAWEAPRICLTPPAEDQFEGISDILVEGIAPTRRFFEGGSDEYEEYEPRCPFEVHDASRLNAACLALARRALRETPPGLEIIDPLEVPFASHEHVRPSPDGVYPSFDSRSWRVGYGARLGGRRVVWMVEAGLVELDGTGGPPHLSFAAALKGGELEALSVGVAFPSPDAPPTIAAEAADILWLHDVSELLRPDEIVLKKLLKRLDEPAVRRLARRHRLPEHNDYRNLLLEIYRREPRRVLAALTRQDLEWLLRCPFEVFSGTYATLGRAGRMSVAELVDAAEALWFEGRSDGDFDLIEASPDAVEAIIAKRRRS